MAIYTTYKRSVRADCHASGLAVFIGGCALGIIAFIFIYGVKVLNVTYDAWLVQGKGYTEDLTQHYLGWIFLRDSPWSFPLGLIEGLAYPDKVSVIYTDSIPLFAVFFKLFNGILPQTFQYFGIWGLVCFALQGGFGALIVKKFTGSMLICWIASVFFIFSPIMMKRMFYHTALAGHWIILCAICIWIYADCFESPKRNVLVWTGLVVVTILTNMYFTPMVIGIMLCYFLRRYLKEREFITAIVTIICTLAIGLLTMFLFGGFYGGVSGGAGGLGVFSFNLNGLYNPQGYSYFIKTQELVQPGQNEGFSFLGTGMLVLLAISLFIYFGKRSESRVYFYDVLPAGIAIAVFAFLALSPIVTFNEKVLFTIPFPEFIIKILSIFRSSGRFIWVVYYMIFVLNFYIIVKINRRNVSIILLLVCSIIQLFDIKELIGNEQKFFKQTMVYQSSLESPIWQESFAKKYKHIMFYAPIWDLYVDPNIGYNFAVYANKNNMTLNGIYFSRDLSIQIDTKTLAHFDLLSQNAIQTDDTLYIFTDKERVPDGNYGLKYQNIDGYIVGLKK